MATDGRERLGDATVSFFRHPRWEGSHRDRAYGLRHVPRVPGTALAPGVVPISLLIERSLDQGLRFDFLKGAQDYKLRLGGVPVDLIAVTVER